MEFKNPLLKKAAPEWNPDTKSYEHPDRCPACKGKGTSMVPDAFAKETWQPVGTCPECKGTGKAKIAGNPGNPALAQKDSATDNERYVFFFDLGDDAGGEKRIVGQGTLKDGDHLCAVADQTWDKYVNSGGEEVYPWWYGGILCALPLQGGVSLQTDEGGQWYGDPAFSKTAQEVKTFISQTTKDSVDFNEQRYQEDAANQAEELPEQ